MKLLALQCPAPLVHSSTTLGRTPCAHTSSIPTCTPRPCVSRHNAASMRRQPTHRNTIVYASTEEVEIDVEETTMERMEKSLEAVKRSFTSVRTGRANPSMLDRIEVDYYGTPTPLKTIAGISVPESTQLLVQPYDTSAMQAIEKAIMASDLGVTPSNDGKIIRINIPPLTAERRKEMTKTVSKLGEEGKVAIRNVRRDSMKAIEKLEKDGAVGEDERKSLEGAVQKLTDEYIKEVDGLIKSKQDELSKV